MAETNATPHTNGPTTVDQLWERFLASKPLAKDQAEVNMIEEISQKNDQFRRAVLASMKFGGAELLEKSKDDDAAKVLAMVIVGGEHWLAHTTELSDLVKNQIARLRMSLFERPDMDSLFIIAESELCE